MGNIGENILKRCLMMELQLCIINSGVLKNFVIRLLEENILKIGSLLIIHIELIEKCLGEKIDDKFKRNIY